MNNPCNPATCEHQLVFSPALEHAAVCKRCGAIALISPRDGQYTLAAIKWIVPSTAPSAGAGSPAAD